MIEKLEGDNPYVSIKDAVKLFHATPKEVIDNLKSGQMTIDDFMIANEQVIQIAKVDVSPESQQYADECFRQMKTPLFRQYIMGCIGAV